MIDLVQFEWKVGCVGAVDERGPEPTVTHKWSPLPITLPKGVMDWIG